MNTTIFWDVDTQYDFMRDDEDHRGALAIPGAQAIESNLSRLTGFARDRGILIVHTRDCHTLDSPEISDNPDFTATFPPHCMAGTRGAESIPATEPENALMIDWRDENINPEAVIKAREIILTKDRFDCFTGSPHTEQVLQMLAPECIVVFGVATNVCVDQAVRGMLERNYAVTVVTDAIRELPNLPVEPVIAEWHRMGALLKKTEDVTSP